MIVCGIDPGLDGALAFYDTSDNACIVHDMPTLRMSKREVDPHALASLLWKSHAGHAYIEAVHAMPKQGSVSMFQFGKGFGIVIGVLAGVGIPMTFITPQSWKKLLAVPRAKDGAKARASQLLPQAAHQWPRVKDEGRAEAALIALAAVQSLHRIAA